MTEPTVCPVNVSAAGRRRRGAAGAAALAVTAGAHFAFHPGHPWTLHVAAGLFYGWLCMMQAVTGT